GLRQMQGSRHPACSFSPPTPRFPVSFQCSPYRFPILRRGFHHHFLDLLLDQPRRKQLQLLGVASVPASLELVFLVDFHVSHNHRQLLLMDINSGCPIWHRSLLAGAESVPEITLSRLSGYRRSHGGKATHHLFALSRTLRIRQIHGLGFSTVSSISPRPARAGLSLSSERFSCGFAGRRPQMTDPDMNVSAHPALIVQSAHDATMANEQTAVGLATPSCKPTALPFADVVSSVCISPSPSLPSTGPDSATLDKVPICSSDHST